MQPRVIDISHHNKVTDMHATASAGVWGVIHKATQGGRYRDPTYALRRSQAKAAGMLWGAYHFNDGTDVAAQVENFLTTAKPDASTLLVLDYEDNREQGGNMTPQQMVQFLRLIEERTGTKAALYSGNRIKENVGRLSAADRAYVTSHMLWLCQYGPMPKLPQGWTSTFLWQYTDGRVGPGPHGVPGVTGDVDLNAFNGTREHLESLWVPRTAPQVAPTLSPVTADQPRTAAPRSDASDAAPASDDTVSLPPFLRAGQQQTDTGGLKVVPQSSRYDVAVEIVQRELDKMGYHEVGNIDGKWGGKTAAAIKAFYVDRGLESQHSEMGQVLNDAISQAKAEGFKRSIAPERANAKPADIAPRVESVRVSLWGRLSAKIAAGFAAVGLTGSTASDTFAAVNDKLQPLHDMLNAVPGTVWFILMLAVAGAVWYFTNRAAKAATNDYNTGRLN